MAIGTAPLVLGTAGITALGLWANDKTIGIKYVVGTGIYALSLSMLGQANADFASKFALFVFVTALLIYGVDIGKKTGLISTGSKGILGDLGGAVAGVLGK